MRVKIGDEWISSEDQPLAVELTAEEWQKIVDRGPPAPYKIARFVAKCPKVIRTPAELQAWARDFDPNCDRDASAGAGMTQAPAIALIPRKSAELPREDRPAHLCDRHHPPPE